jgi:ribonuclease G
VPNELIVNVTLGETRVARLENGVVAEVYIERSREASVVGNIYKGKVVRVLPGMEAAFIEVGLDRTAFLHASDIVAEEMHVVTELAPGADEVKDVAPGPSEAAKYRYRGARIQDLLKEGKDIIVQVAKDALGTKGARLTSFISLPGRYLVYMPTVDHLGVSRKIESDKERKRLKNMIEKLRKGISGGFIVRTASEGLTQKEAKADINYLTEMWKSIEDKSEKSKPPASIHSDLDVVLRVVRDLFTEDVDRMVIDSVPEFDRISSFVSKFNPKLKNRIEIYQGDEPIFDAFGIEVEITRALGQKVWLKSGGYIIIEQTEALTAIDVNTGRFVGKRNVEDTILKTNLEAVKEIVYQLRLRNIGGIIILDFIDMQRIVNREKVYNALQEVLKNDRARTKITKISSIGLVEMTRKRTREDIRNILADPCPYCEGKGYLKSPNTICYEVFREIRREMPDIKEKHIVVYAHPTVVNTLYDEERRSLENLEAKYKKRVTIKAVPDYHLEQFDIVEK